jgi:hypothetical protein
MAELTPLEKVPGLDDATRRKLEETYWITSAEELVGAAKADNAQHGSGLAALAIALGKSDDQIFDLISAAQDVAPGASSFEGFAEMIIGDGLVIDDLSDIEAGSFATPVVLPDAVEPLATLPPPANQGKRNTCVTFTLAACFQALSGDETDLSEQFLYWVCKSRDNIKGDVGTNPLLALKIMQEVGVCTEATWPYKPGPVDNINPGHEKPPEAAFAEAKRRRISGFTQLPGKDVNRIRQALAEKKPVLIGLPIWESWTSAGQARRLGKLRKELPGERRGGGHAMCILGYRNDEAAPGGGYFIVRNSWGTDWAKENPDGPGYCRVPYQLVFEQGLIAFAVEGVAEYREEVVVTSGGSARSAGLLGGSGEGGSIQDLYARAVSIQEQLSALVADLAALAGDAPAPATIDDAVEAVATIASPPPEVVAPQTKGYSGPLIRIAESGAGAGEELLTNGIDGVTGEYLLRIDAATASKLAGFDPDPKELKLAQAAKVKDATTDHFGTVGDISSVSVRQARWAVVVSANEDAGLLKAIWPLIQRRMEQMEFTKRDYDFRAGETCAQWLGRHTDGMTKTTAKNWGEVPPVLIHRPGERVNTWLSRHGASNGPVDPRMGVPYYLMLLSRPGALKEGDSTFVGLNFQYELDIFFAVGRLCFTDATGQYDLKAYEKYAERVAAFERRSDAAARVSKEVVYFGTKHKLDRSTIRSADELINPLVRWHANPENTPALGGYGHTLYMEGDATRSNLEKILRGGDAGKPPAVLFTASHGLGLPMGDERLVQHQGSLVTQDWKGLGSIKREHWFAGEDLADVNLEGTMAVLFACYGAGCPQYDEFVFDEKEGRAQVAPFPFIAQLPQRLLQSGCLAVLGHVERAWTHSFTGGEAAKAQIQPFQDIIARLMQGRPVGDALDQFNVIQGQRAARLADELEDLKFGKIPDPVELAQLWVSRNDARNYALLGDPAVKVPFPAVEISKD